uniref:TLC domain-containing protein n=1 Tax=Chromera velia CCMP2878 TaxID=1169474 RepID=A0A0G4HLK6_9ALVE|eukprot:Cvel_28985.t1-p1 / transcript=Cvel_28985.t1 / gene=Cvel_28985 / organism=Chromera_velia_CCMP2878 / gene_product=hypothetical protein / transcript_product=hypothetical protein / location=Cvel_scaffold3897:878-3169(-) / protein_length=188 / sequence_SO=supercontig / SO=protein_coding / is_pseudo=false
MAVHNWFNLFTLPTILLLAFRDLWYWSTDTYTQTFVISYFIIDFFWILAGQQWVVKDPASVLLHHAATIVLLVVSTFREEYKPFWSSFAMIEVNTVLLLALRSGKLEAWLGPIASIFHTAFLLSWFPLRWGCPLYTLGALVSFWFESGHDKVHLTLMIVCSLLLLHMQVKWSAKLLNGQIRTMVSHGL